MMKLCSCKTGTILDGGDLCTRCVALRQPEMLVVRYKGGQVERILLSAIESYGLGGADNSKQDELKPYAKLDVGQKNGTLPKEENDE